MSCFGSRVAPDLLQNGCCSNTLCEFDGNMKNVTSEPIFVQKVYDAVLFNLQGLKSVSGQTFCPAIPRGHRLKRVTDIRCKRSFNPCNVDDPTNLRLDVEATISGADFVQNGCGETISVVGADGTFSEKILYAEVADGCDGSEKSSPIFGTQNIRVTGNVDVTMDLLLCDRNDREVTFTVSASVPIAEDCHPLLLTNFFELCIPSACDSAFLPRFTEFCNTACETRLATNNVSRDITICPDGSIRANLMIALCISCEKKIVVPVQMCVLSTGYVELTPQTSPICTSFPQLFPDNNQCVDSDTDDCCCEPKDPCRDEYRDSRNDHRDSRREDHREPPRRDHNHRR